MDFKPVSSKRYETLVEAVPSHPEGYFIREDLFVGKHIVRLVELRRIKPSHVRALKRGDASVMNRYVVTEPARPDLFSFTNCDPGVPDPLQPIGTTVYVRGVQEVSPIDSITNAQAVEEARPDSRT